MMMDTILESRIVIEIEKEPAKRLPQPNENIKRSLLKTISWRIVGTIATVLISWVITGTLALAFSIGAVELVSKMVLYFFHERAWNNVNWGK